jgi:hypothetical protein
MNTLAINRTVAVFAPFIMVSPLGWPRLYCTTPSVPQYSPMIPTQVPKPFLRDGWVYEEKVDG